MLEKCKPLIELFTENGWSVEIEKDYLPDSHFNESKENYQKFTGGRISFTKKQKLSGLYSNGTLVEVFPKIDGFGVDFVIEDNADGLDYTFEEIDILLNDAITAYKEHSEFLAELHKHQEGERPQVKQGKQMKESMQGKMVTFLRIPLIHNCDYYDDSEADWNVLVYFTITEPTFKRVLEELSNELDKGEKWIIEDLTRCQLNEIKNEAELHSMHYVFDKVYKTKDLARKEIVYPKEFDALYETYVQNNGIVIDKLGRKWKVGNDVLTKENFMWASYHEQYSQIE